MQGVCNHSIQRETGIVSTYLSVEGDDTVLKDFSHFFACFFAAPNKKAGAEVVHTPPPILTDFLFIVERFVEFSFLDWCQASRVAKRADDISFQSSLCCAPLTFTLDFSDKKQKQTTSSNT